MPELPEVQTTVNGLNAYTKGLTITDVWTNYESKFHTGKDNIKDPKFFSFFKKEVTGKKINGASRRAKNILIELSGGVTILVHMKMTGHLLYGKYSFDVKEKKDPWTAAEEGALKDPFNKFIRLVFTLSNGKHLALSDMRRFAKVTLINSKDIEKISHLENIGPEPLEKDFTFGVFESRINKRPNGKIKQVLMDQALIAGIGNIYSDEVLWHAGIHPEEKVKDIPETKRKLMFNAVKSTLKKGIDFGGDSMSDYRNLLGERGKFQEKHNAYRRTGKPCKKPGCGGTIIRKIVGGRSAHFCDTHQKLI